ncbi:hypothetical protein B296_00021923, partial [Ensete ventricosum]
GGESALVAGPEGAQPEVEVIHAEASAKRPAGSPVLDQTATGQPGKQVKIAVRKHKSYRAAKQIVLASLLEAKLEKLRSERDPKQLAWAKQRVGKLEADNAKLKSGLDELSSRLDEADKELNELREGLVESQCQLKEQKVGHRKADDDLLKLMRENESLKVELPGKSVANYKQSVDNDPFTEQPEDGLVLMETRQEFDDSIPSEE